MVFQGSTTMNALKANLSEVNSKMLSIAYAISWDLMV